MKNPNSRTILYDRFIPSRSSSNFSIFKISRPSTVYATLHWSALFDCKPGCNIFRYKTETHSVLPFDEERPTISHSHFTRKVIASPYKVKLIFFHPPALKYFENTAAVKAIAWSPHLHGLLAFGGGTADRCIRVWNTTTNSHLSCMDTGSQVRNLVWSKNVNELVSAHGQPGKFQFTESA